MQHYNQLLSNGSRDYSSKLLPPLQQCNAVFKKNLNYPLGAPAYTSIMPKNRRLKTPSNGLTA